MHAMMVNPFFVGKTGGETDGSMMLNSNGTGSASFQGVGANTTYSFSFCPFPGPYQGCPAIAVFTTDGSGNATVSFQMMQKGTFAGVFVAETPNNPFFDSGFLFSSNGDQYLSPLVRASAVSGGVGTLVIGSEPLASGQVTMTGSAPHVVVQGAQPNTTYTVTYCLNDGQTCGTAGTLATDASGNGEVDVGPALNQQWFEGVYYLSDANGVQYITGFTLQ